MADILVVDDEPEIVSVIKRALESDGHRVSGYVGTEGIDVRKINYSYFAAYNSPDIA